MNEWATECATHIFPSKNRNSRTLKKKEKEGPKGYPPRRPKKLIFYIRTVKRNRNEIEARKKSDFEPRRKKKKKKKKMKGNERK